MKKIYTLISGALLIIASAAQMNAQCAGNRYHDYIFPTAATPVSGVVYGSNLTYSNTVQSLLLDVYQPVGDVATNRALVIIAHGGSFVGGGRTGSDVVPLAVDLAKMGYVTASIDYRLGMTHLLSGGPPDSVDAGAAVMRATQDARAAVRFFRNNARTGGNTYSIDTNNIFFGGVSAGGIMVLHLAYCDQESEFPAYVDTVGQYGLHGGIQGLSGNQGYPSTVKAIVNICGALGDTLWMHTGDTPLLSFHGTADGTVPYGYAEIYLLSAYPILKVYGSSTVNERATHQLIPNCMETWVGQDHVPEVSSAAYFDSTITITRTFLEHFTCNTAMNCSYTEPLGINALSDNIDFSIYPNPANTSATIDLIAFTGHSVNIELYNSTGQKVKSISSVKSNQYIINRDNLTTGIYFMNVISDGKVFSKKIIFE